MKTGELNQIESADYRSWLTALKLQVKSAQNRAAFTVNRELLQLYWHIGHEILTQQQAKGWGAKVVKQLAQDLKQAFPELKGFSERNLKYMRQFAQVWSEPEFVQQAVAQLPWGHHLVLMSKLSSRDQRLAYAAQTVEYGWSRNILVHQIESGLLQRQGAASTNFVERALTEHVSQFLLELGAGFAFVGKQVHLEVGGDDFYLDLLFYHLKLRCYIVIELKAGEFKPEHTGQLNFYLSAVDSQIKSDADAASIGLLLCKTRNKIVAEYALRDNSKPIGIAEYQLAQALPADLEDKLPSIEHIERGLCRNDENEGISG